MTSRMIIVLAAGLLALTGLAQAQQSPAAPSADESKPTASAPAQSERYMIAKSGNDILRVDRKTGAISVCRARGERWVCELVADDRAAYEAEIGYANKAADKLKKRVADLEQRLAALEENPNAKSGAKEPSLSDKAERELDRFMTFSEHAMRRFFGMVKSLREDYEAGKI